MCTIMDNKLEDLIIILIITLKSILLITNEDFSLS